MKTLLTIPIILTAMSANSQHQPWPILKHYDVLDRIAMPVGGVGTGDIALGGNGEWKEVEIMNKPGMAFFGSETSKRAPCFMVYTKDQTGHRASKALLGPVASYEYEGWEGSHASNHGMPRFAQASFDVAYP